MSLLRAAEKSCEGAGYAPNCGPPNIDITGYAMLCDALLVLLRGVGGSAVRTLAPRSGCACNAASTSAWGLAAMMRNAASARMEASMLCVAVRHGAKKWAEG